MSISSRVVKMTGIALGWMAPTTLFGSPLSSMARAIVKELVEIANRRAEELEKREGRVVAARFLLVSPSGDDQPIDGHALSVAMARFGKAFDLKCKDDAQELEAEHAKAAASWFEDRRLLTTFAGRWRQDWLRSAFPRKT
jgi:hypothetical protein